MPRSYPSPGTAHRLALLIIVAGLASPGCWWMRDQYTARMQSTLRGEAGAGDLDSLVGEPVADQQFGFYIRPPKPARPVAAAPGVLAQMEGGELEVVVIGNAEPAQDFLNSALAKLNAAGKGPGAVPTKQDSTINSLYGGLLEHTMYAIQAQRAVAGAAPVTYNWFIYIVEQPPQQVMVAFLIPDAKYAQYGQAMVRSMETLALRPKLSDAMAKSPAR